MISAIILAAGKSQRMGKENKLLLPVDGEALIRRFVKFVCLSEVENILVVIGYQSDRVKAVLEDQPVDFVYNPLYKEGITSSIKTGVQTVSDESDGYMICLSDMPFARTRDFNLLLRAFKFSREKGRELVTIPVFRGERGNPVIFSSEFRGKILEHEGEGCRGIVAKNLSSSKEVVMDNGNLFYDIDTPEDYKKFI